MALEVISNAVYHGAAKTPEKLKAETTAVKSNSVTINIEDVPSAFSVAGASGTSREKYEYNNDRGNVQKDAQVSEQQIKDAVSQVNSKLKMHRTRCEFSYHEETKRVSIKVFDKETDEVIREIPPEQTLEMVQKAWELAGFLVDEKR